LPIIIPLIDYNFLSEPDSLGGRYSLDTNLGVFSRIEGRDTRRLSVKGGWEIPFLGPIGDLYRISASVQADGYWVDNFDSDSPEVNPPGTSDTDVVGRFFPQIAAQWRYPLASDSVIGHQVLEPVVQVVAAPDWANNDDIPNEDSLSFEFDDTNLLSLNRFPGVDRVDPGSRVDYGLEWSVSSASIGEASAFMGQSYRLEEDDAFATGSGLEDKISDVVGRIRLVPQKDIDVSYRFRLDHDDLSAKRHELDLRIGPPALELDLTYIFDDFSTAEFDSREELSFRLKSQLNENWFIEGAHRRDLENDDSLETAIGLTYQDECFLITVEGKRTYFEDREISEDDSVMVKLVFKFLGEVGVSQ
jgi:LPS-assembly protein